MIAACNINPDAMILGIPIFGADAPSERVNGRRIGNWFTQLETLWGGVYDSLFGFRLYPIAPSIAVMESISSGRRFDFETQLAVRLYWQGVPPLSFPSKVTYPPQTDGGITQFKYLRDNWLLVRTHIHLCFLAILMLPRLLVFRSQRTPPPSTP